MEQVGLVVFQPNKDEEPFYANPRPKAGIRNTDVPPISVWQSPRSWFIVPGRRVPALS